MKTETIVRNITETARPDSVELKLLASGTYGFEAKVYFNSERREDTKDAMDRLTDIDKALRVLFPMAENKLKKENDELKQRLEAAELEIAQLQDQRKEKFA